MTFFFRACASLNFVSLDCGLKILSTLLNIDSQAFFQILVFSKLFL